LESYDPERGEWRWLEDMPTARSDLGVAVIDGKLYAVGGFDSRSYSSALEVYDPGTDEWTRLPDMPTARSNLGVATIGGRLYAVGGLTYERGFAVEIYDPDADRWGVAANMIAARTGPGVGTAGGRLYAFGGNRFGGPTWEVYDPGANRWTAMPEPPFRITEVGIGAVGSRLYVVGPFSGTDWKKRVSLCHSFNLETSEWARLPDLPAVAGLEWVTNKGVVAVNDRLCVVGAECDMERLVLMGAISAGAVTTFDVLDPN
jgi:N-acetylneuraminic acid mutarotase